MSNLFIKNPGPYSGVTCRFFDKDTGKCSIGIETEKNDLHHCSVGFTYCREWRDNGVSIYAYNDYYEQYDNVTWLPLSYHAIEVLKDNPNYLELRWK